MNNEKHFPLVSVLMPMHNEELHLGAAIESILSQTYKNFEFLIINDGSIDRSEAIALSYNDTRIRYLKNEQNLGISKTLNKGIALAKGEYIFRMDADDLSLPTRMEKQVEFMQLNPEIGACSTAVLLFGATNREFKYYEDNIEIRTNLIIHPSLSNGAMIMRKSVLEKLDKWYDSKMDAAEDHDLWERMSHHTKFANLPEVLYHYRMHQGNGHLAVPERLFGIVMKIRQRIIERHLNREMTTYELEILNKALGRGKPPLNKKELKAFHQLLCSIQIAIKKAPDYSAKISKKGLAAWWKLQMRRWRWWERILLLFVLPPLTFHWIGAMEMGRLFIRRLSK